MTDSALRFSHRVREESCPFCGREFDYRYWTPRLFNAHLVDCKASKPVMRHV